MRVAPSPAAADKETTTIVEMAAVKNLMAFHFMTHIRTPPMTIFVLPYSSSAVLFPTSWISLAAPALRSGHRSSTPSPSSLLPYNKR